MGRVKKEDEPKLTERRNRVKFLMACEFDPIEMIDPLVADGYFEIRPGHEEEDRLRAHRNIKKDCELIHDQIQTPKQAILLNSVEVYEKRMENIRRMALQTFKTDSEIVTEMNGFGPMGPVDTVQKKRERRINFAALTIAADATKNIARVQGVPVDGVKDNANASKKPGNVMVVERAPKGRGHANERSDRPN